MSTPQSVDPDLQRAEKYRSIFEKPPRLPSVLKSAQPLFLPPEGVSQFGMESDELGIDLQTSSSWDVATRYHEFKSMRSFQGKAKHLRHLSVRAILERAQEILGSLVHPMDARVARWGELPSDAEQIDIDLDETIENSPLAVASVFSLSSPPSSLYPCSDHFAANPLTEQDLWMSYSIRRRQSIILSVDTSLSMTGEKLALTAVALAVVLLEFPDDPIGIVAFENEAKVLKSPDEKISLQLLIERFLDVPAQGYTHLEDGMKVALQLVKRAQSGGHGRPASVVLLTDGKYTAGRDPGYLASRFPHLVVLKMGSERASFELCREMARKGRGALREVGELESLPRVMYAVVQDLLRGRSLA